MRWMAGLAALLVSTTACEQTLVHPDGAASLDLMEGGDQVDTVNINTGYFGSGHVEPPILPTDSIKGAPHG